MESNNFKIAVIMSLQPCLPSFHFSDRIMWFLAKGILKLQASASEWENRPVNSHNRVQKKKKNSLFQTKQRGFLPTDPNPLGLD